MNVGFEPVVFKFKQRNVSAQINISVTKVMNKDK